MKRYSKEQRRGAAFVLLVTALLLVVLAAMLSLLKSEVASRTHQREQAMANMMLRALEVARQTDAGDQQPIRFPVDEDLSVVVTTNSANTQLVATLYAADQAIQTLQRPINIRDKQAQ